MVGDLILDVNAHDIRKMAYNDVAFLLKTLPQGKVALRIGRFKASSSASSPTSAVGTPSAQGSKQTSRRASLVNQTSTTVVTICEQSTVIATADNADNQNTSSSKLTTFKPCLKK
jgi:hypothetical protein